MKHFQSYLSYLDETYGPKLLPSAKGHALVSSSANILTFYSTKVGQRFLDKNGNIVKALNASIIQDYKTLFEYVASAPNIAERKRQFAQIVEDAAACNWFTSQKSLQGAVASGLYCNERIDEFRQIIEKGKEVGKAIPSLDVAENERLSNNLDKLMSMAKKSSKIMKDAEDCMIRLQTIH